VRHGESSANVEGIISSNPDIATKNHGLTDKGKDEGIYIKEICCNIDMAIISFFASPFLTSIFYIIVQFH
jgi:bisphosphoglycerate-dependent phosphoglycerate mutase